MPLFFLAGAAVGGGISVTAALSLLGDAFKRGLGRGEGPLHQKGLSHSTPVAIEQEHGHKSYHKALVADWASSSADQCTEEAQMCQHAHEEEGTDFELWVETELDASWCLESDALPTLQSWKESCQTASIRRPWGEFERLTERSRISRSPRRKSEACHAEDANGNRILGQGPQGKANLRALGLKEGATEAQVRAQFRKLCLACHPDKGGSSKKFEKVLDAYRALTVSAS
eukprot:gb/GFBE01032909.1/.p1 GENE.gb/GFBE01032909.1/~~gb/GFBE01032909.1/.p1  ORF type:complete len:229 (+),score=34.32 gb/GFBE01032909.1/:1-687(+)